MTATITAEVQKVHEITKIDDNIRGAYDNYRSGKSPDPIDTVFSIRESVHTAFELDDFFNIKSAVKDVLLPKADTREEKWVLETIIDNV